MKDCAVIGIDPGKAGGIAVWIRNKCVTVAKIPEDMADLRDMLEYYRDNYGAVVFLEKLSLRPDDVRVQDGQANLGKMYRVQKMIENYAQLKATIEIAGVPYIMVHPCSWMATLGLRLKGVKEEKPERKRRFAGYARRLYPLVKVTLWNADALLIMTFGRKMLETNEKWIKSNLPQREHHKLF